MRKEELIAFENSSTKLNKEKKEKPSFNFEEYKSIIYTALFYSFGLFIGAYFYKISSSETLDLLLKPEEQSVISLFISNFCIYFSLFVLVVFLGFCLIGYPIINIIPTVIGIVTGIKSAYLYINFSEKGIGYSLIMLIPYVALLLTVLAFTINLSSTLSKKLINITKNTDEPIELDVKPYIRKYLVLALCIMITTLIEACLTSLLFTVVAI
ncbi:MAG: stage II sporulation protein M [Eubacterium sp.]|nr:stage II sporulation protein M [Eubacterium sp.]